MKIREFFEKMFWEDFNEAENLADEMYEKFENDDPEFYKWAEENGIDLDNEDFTRWCWDMCGD